MITNHDKAMDKKWPFGRVASSFNFCQTEWAFSFQVSLESKHCAAQNNALPVAVIGNAKF